MFDRNKIKQIRQFAVLCMAITLFIVNTMCVSAYVEEYDYLFNISEELYSVATENEYNIMLYDCDGKILREYHCDGETVSYIYEDSSKLKILNSNGNNVEIIEQGGLIMVSEFIGTQQIDKFCIEKTYSSIKREYDREERNMLLKAAAEGLLDYENVDSNILMPNADTISSGYNLSTLCPSVWTSAMGYDKFVRPSTALTKDEIQTFLESKNSVLAKDILVYKLDSNGNVYNTGITINPATAIDDAARDYIINPKIILGSLQREQGLITKTSGDVSTRSFYYCMGYGATDGGDINSCSGFDNQIDKGTELYAELWSEAYNMGKNSFPMSFSASDGTVSINNCGTYALYKYTPWKSSNLLFLQIMKGYWPSSSGVNGIDWS